MKNKPKLILVLSIVLVILAASSLMMGAPRSVEARMAEGYNFWVLGFCFLSMISLANALSYQLRPEAVWGFCSGLCLPAGTLLIAGLNFYFYTARGYFPSLMIVGYLIEVAGLICFLASAVFSRRT